MGSVIEWDDTLELAASKAHKAKSKKPAVKVKASMRASGSVPKLSKPKSRKAKRKERRKKILRGVGAVATGGVSLAVSKKAPKALRKIGKGLAVVATGGAAGGIMVAKKLAKKRKASKARSRAVARSGPPRLLSRKPPVVRAAVSTPRLAAKSRIRKVARTAAMVAPLAPHLKVPTVAYEPKIPAAEVLSRPLVGAMGTDKAEKFADSLQTLAARVDKAACDAVQTAKSRARGRRSRLKLQLFSKLRHLTSKLPVTDPTRVKANRHIVLHCRQMSG